MEKSKAIIYRVVNYATDRGLLGQSPHLFAGDLTIGFFYLLSRGQTGMRVGRIDNEGMKQLGLCLEDLRKLAAVNTVGLMPLRISAIGEYLPELAMRGVMDACIRDLAEAYPNELSFKPPAALWYEKIGSLCGSAAEKMLVLNNENGYYGATSLLYPECFTELEKRAGGAFYYALSSVNEVVVIPDSIEAGCEQLTQLAREIERKFAYERIVLSERIYHYPEDKIEYPA